MSQVISICGVNINDIGIDELLHRLKTSLANSTGTEIVVTPNIDHLQRLTLADNGAFKRAYQRASFTLCDSRVFRIAARLKGKRIINVVPGSDLTERLLNEHWVKQCKVCFIGPSDRDCENIRARYTLSHLSHYSPPMGFIENFCETQKCLDFIEKSAPSILFLAVGSPRQEILASMIKDTSQHSMIVLCIGASLDFLSGKTSRAPKWIQILHLEWMHRMLSEPMRLAPRYFKNAKWLISFIVGTAN
ncbi:WecB/TagA/CpsF family glycosyl transferase [Pseudomonas knackmussii B13]|uniref:WecB/TagA/CpsF family glycosyl transferase n=1 Tax=Pseudomonas knackmussii (strain DSM 6978 / CCUG 54928 / LMG 23759 / B13) TaxID=1301098 RepID=A0A024HDG4_PSEKB|nr:WecB/TagA/CpsF family glycosyltransferase [Pseudomonas knackmussii]CDF82552.1 WecB/TagA/CpsF family glycosyl transferase [Pseudomonas knackmussii B13]